jgi:hypothetical protein
MPANLRKTAPQRRFMPKLPIRHPHDRIAQAIKWRVCTGVRRRAARAGLQAAGSVGATSRAVKPWPDRRRRHRSAWGKPLISVMAQMRSADCIEQCLGLEEKRKTSARTEYFAFWPNGDMAAFWLRRSKMSMRPIPLVAIPCFDRLCCKPTLTPVRSRGMSVRRIGEQRLQKCARFSCP